jgi:transcriptional regulator with XRE-family HTH domain
MVRAMYAEVMETLADLVRDAREARAMTQEQLDEAAGMSPGYTAQLEIGRVRRPQPATMRKLAAALGLSLEDFGVATGQLDGPREDVVAALEEIDRLSTEAERLAKFRQLPRPIQRSIRRLAVDFLSAASEELMEPDGSPVDREAN